MSAPAERRKRRLIEPRVQKRFIWIFLSLAALAALVQSLVVSYLLVRLADGLPNDGLALKTQILELLAQSLPLTLALLAPLTVAVGITSTHRIVGPLYRFRVYLTQLAAGERPAPCRIRQDDELQDLCELLNRATAPLRETSSAEGARGEAA